MTEQEISVWHTRISKVIDFGSKRDEQRKQILKLYLSEFFGDPTKDGEYSQVSFVYEYVKILIGGIYAKDPYIFVRAKSGRRAKFAETMEMVINFYWRELKVKNKIKKAILDATLFSVGFTELGYLFLKERKDNLTIELEREFPELKEVKPLEEQGIFDETVKEDDCFVDYLSSWDVYWPEGYNEIRDCPYLIAKKEMSLLDIHSNPMFKKVKFELVDGMNMKTTPSNPQNFRFKDEVRPINMIPDVKQDLENIKITLYRVFDKRSRKRFVLAKNFIKDTLFERDWEYLPDGHTIFPLIFNPIPKTNENSNSYPLSDIVPLLPQLRDLSKITSAMIRHVKRSGAVILVRKGTMTPTEITNIQTSKDLDVVEVESIGDEVIKAVTMPGLGIDFYKLREIILDDLFRASGFKQLLASALGVETATESENIRAGSLIRQSEKIDIIEDYSQDVASYLAGLIWQYVQDKNRIAEIVGEEVSEDMWPSLPEDEQEARKIIQKEIYFEIEAGSTKPPKDESVERKQWQDLVSVIEATFPGRLRQDIILPQLLKKYDFKDIDQAIIGFDEEEAQVAQQENQLLLQGIPIPVSPNQNHTIHLQIHVQQAESGQTSPALDQHIVDTAAKQERLSPNVRPQRGDNKISPRSKSPDIFRQGVPDNVDFTGSLKEKVLGANKGR